ncbi:MAG: hypothetical protein J5504_08515 [Butyrivibrio sp.]|nr:hypothetical protein [Butyrivibrio sp.]
MSKLTKEEVGLSLVEALENAKESIVEEDFDTAITELVNAIEQAKDYKRYFAKEYLIAYRQLCLAFRKKGDIQKAAAKIRKAEDFCRMMIMTTDESTDMENELAVCYVNEGILFEASGDHENSAVCYENAFSIFKRNNDIGKMLKLILTMILNYHQKGDLKQVQRLFCEADEILNDNQVLEEYKIILENVKTQLKEEDGCDY